MASNFRALLLLVEFQVLQLQRCEWLLLPALLP
jgi:hypothetical protein